MKIRAEQYPGTVGLSITAAILFLLYQTWAYTSPVLIWWGTFWASWFGEGDPNTVDLIMASMLGCVLALFGLVVVVLVCLLLWELILILGTWTIKQLK